MTCVWLFIPSQLLLTGFQKMMLFVYDSGPALLSNFPVISCLGERLRPRPSWPGCHFRNNLLHNDLLTWFRLLLSLQLCLQFEKPSQGENSNSELLFRLRLLHICSPNSPFRPGQKANGGSPGEQGTRQTSGDSRSRQLNSSQRVTFQVLLSRPEHSSHDSRWKPWQREIRAGIPQLSPQPLPYSPSLPRLSSIAAVRMELTWPCRFHSRPLTPDRLRPSLA